MKDRPNNKLASIIYFSHGGGPLPILGDPSHGKMIKFLKELPSKLPKPDEILVISAHWEESYELQYPVQGNPFLAKQVQNLLEINGIQSTMTAERGFDHGLFIPLKIMYPEADIPTTELSLIKGLNPNDHLRPRKALTTLAEKNILIIGSGFSFHNMRAFTWDLSDTEDSANNEFQNWLIDVCCGSYSLLECEDMFIDGSSAPYARYCHPREEHLLPLHVCFGIAGAKSDVIHDDYILGKRAVAFKW